MNQGWLISWRAANMMPCRMAKKRLQKDVSVYFGKKICPQKTYNKKFKILLYKNHPYEILRAPLSWKKSRDIENINNHKTRQQSLKPQSRKIPEIIKKKKKKKLFLSWQSRALIFHSTEIIKAHSGKHIGFNLRPSETCSVTNVYSNFLKSKDSTCQV